MNKGYLLTIMTAAICLSLGMNKMPVMAEALTEAYEETGLTIPEDAIEISTAEELMAVNENLSANYVLTEDIDLGGMEWTPLGAFAPSGDTEEEQEIPDLDLAFTGFFSGNGHTISNFVIDQPEGMAIGLFGCIANATVENLTVKNASATASIMASDVIGYAFCSTVDYVTLEASTVTAASGEYSGEGMYGGIVGAGMMSAIINCNATADITIPNDAANTGIVGGGLEMTSVLGCTASGIITAGDNCYGLGGISGCGFASDEFTANTADDVTINTGDGCFWIGGITGYAGGYENASYGMPVTAFTDCAARYININTGENADGIGKIVGAGFYNEQVAEMMGAPYDAPTVYTLDNCVWEEIVTE